MQREGKVRFLKYHDKAVKSVSFNPVERYMCCSASEDGRICVYGYSSFHYLLVSYLVQSGREINAIKFTSDGRKLICALSNRKLAVIDVETGQSIHRYDNCCYSGPEPNRVPILIDKNSPSLAITLFTTGLGITLFDLRSHLPYVTLEKVFENGYTGVIRDMILIDSWPFMPKSEQGIVCISQNGNCNVVNLDGTILHQFDVGHKANTIVRTPEPFDQMAKMTKTGFKSSILVGGDNRLSCYSIDKVTSRNLSIGLLNHSSLAPLPNLGMQQYLSHMNFGLNMSHTSPSIRFQAQFNTMSNRQLFANHNPFHLSNASSRFAQNRRLLNNADIKTIATKNDISLMKYNSSGGLLFAITNSKQGHIVQRYRRYPNDHLLIGEMYRHKSEILDFDISAYDEFIVTASKDKSVGVMCLGSPSHGSTGVTELT